MVGIPLQDGDFLVFLVASRAPPPSCDRIEKLQTRNVRNTQAMRKERKTIVTYNKRVGREWGRSEEREWVGREQREYCG